MENLLFEDESFDLFITQDVMEHVFTAPIINKEIASECWLSKNESGEIVFHREPEYHGNPIDNSGSLVTMHWGWGIADFIQRESSCAKTIVAIDNMEMGIRTEYIEILVSRKEQIA